MPHVVSFLCRCDLQGSPLRHDRQGQVVAGAAERAAVTLHRATARAGAGLIFNHERACGDGGAAGVGVRRRESQLALPDFGERAAAATADPAILQPAVEVSENRVKPPSELADVSLLLVKVPVPAVEVLKNSVCPPVPLMTVPPLLVNIVRLPAVALLKKDIRP